jgi:hypothetical protein
MSYLRHQRFDAEACSLGACGSGVWASRDPQAAKGGQAATTTPHPAASLRLPTRTRPNPTSPSAGRLAWCTDAADRDAIRQPPRYPVG